MSNISGKRRDLVPAKTTARDSEMDTDSSDSDEDSEDEEHGESQTPVLQAVFHFLTCIIGLFY